MESAGLSVEPGMIRVTTSRGTDDGPGSESFDLWHGRIKAACGLLPKTGRTMEIADRHLVVNGKRGFERGSFPDIAMGTSASDEENIMSEMATKAANRHSLACAIGTSLVFALVMLLLAAWLFCRRDY